MSPASRSELIVRREGAAGRITLNRPEALNALTLGMIEGIAEALDAFKADLAVRTVVLDGAGDRGFCAGGDIRALYESRPEGLAFAEDFWRKEYRLDLRIARFPKDVVSFMDGIVMGGGMGVSTHARHRIVTEATAFAMPEAGIGFMPDVGATWLLPRAPGEIGTYLALTGERIGAADCIHAGVADHFVPQAELGALASALASHDEGAADVIRRFARDPGASGLVARRDEIDEYFGGDEMDAILARLETAASEFARRTRTTLLKKSPTSLKITLAAQRRGRTLPSLAACLDMEYRVVLRLFAGRDLHEGIRAAVIDKDRNPRWNPPTIEGVTDEMVARYFEPLGAGELGLEREEKQRPEFERKKGGAVTNISFIGLGNMGAPMAANLVKAGHHVTGFDISATALSAAAEAGVSIAASARQAAADCDVVLTMLPAGQHVIDAYCSGDGILAAVTPGTLLIDSSTIDVDAARRFHSAAVEAGYAALDAPVSGGVAGAASASLTFMVGGEEEAFRRGKPLLEAMGKRIVHCGPSGSGQAAKICNNMILGISMIGVAEAFVLAERLGLSHQALFDVASSSSGQCWSLTSYCPVPGPVPASPANRGYQPGFSAALMLKDLKLSQAAAQDAAAPTPLGAAATQLYALFNSAGHSARDFSGIIEWLRGAGAKD